MKRAAITFLLLFLLLPASYFIAQRSHIFAPKPTPLAPEDALDSQAVAFNLIEKAIREAIAREKEALPALLIYETQIDHLRLSQDEKWATAWLTPLDPETGQTIPTEPGLALAHLEKDTWYAWLPSEAEWVEKVQEVPTDLISPDDKMLWMQQATLVAQAVVGPFSGYYLPYAGGETMALTQSVGHDRYTPSGSAHFAFDFAKQGYPSGMFNVHAARGGTVHRVVWDHPNGNEDHANYLVLEDTTTTPTTYQLYLHLAQDSVPEALRNIGTFVNQGQFLGIADDTGISSGNHLHFHVHTVSTSYWGASVDITFLDVDINGGRPRITSDLGYCKSSDICDQTRTLYLSGNFGMPDNQPPQGGITEPLQGITVNSGTIQLSGWAQDEISGLGSAQFYARTQGPWNAIGNVFSTSPFAFSWNMCSDQAPDGPISLVLHLSDRASNQADPLLGLRHFTKNYACQADPPCSPTSTQIALYTEPDFQGACIVLGAGSYPNATSLDALGDNNAASIQVGSSVRATLFTSNNYLGRSETFIANDSNLTDNLPGANALSSLLVQSRTAVPNIPSLVSPEIGASYPAEASLSLAWQDAGGASQYQARLQLGASTVLTSPWQSEPAWHLSMLAPGSYTWQVKARSGTNDSAWSSARSLTIQSSLLGVQPMSVTAPFTDTMEASPGTWTASNWSRSSLSNHTTGGLYSWKYSIGGGSTYDIGTPNSGYLTSPVIFIPASGEYYLRFWYYYQTEGSELLWDQRRVQISVDGSPFTTLAQLSDDAPNFWLRSPAISLLPYANHTIRIRFYFVTLDSSLNNYTGWLIDDFSVTTTPPPNCADGQNSYVDAALISYGSATGGVICPGGDVDYFKFQGIAGDQIGIWIEAQANGSSLDTYLFLLDKDGRSLLAENDDQVLYERTDSFISYRLTRTATYYIKLRAWDHTTSGSEKYSYLLRLVKDSQDPVASLLYPTDNGVFPLKTINLMVGASDGQSGVSHVEFWWHSGDWLNANWSMVSDDWNGLDGWSVPFDASGLINERGIAFYAHVFDWAGNWIGLGVWNLGPPVIYFPLLMKR